MSLSSKPGRAAPVLDHILERIQERTAVGALRVPRTAAACDLWLGGLNGRGRPQIGFSHEGVNYVAMVGQLIYRRFRYFDAPLPAWGLVCHTCDVQTCVNEQHFYLGDTRANSHDFIRRGSSADQGVLAAEVSRQLELRKGTKLPKWLKQNTRLAKEAA